MKCPVDHSSLNRSVRQGIEIDTCPTCRGVWLDRGELDKIVAQSIAPIDGDLAAADESGPRLIDGTSTTPTDPGQRRTDRRSLFAELFDVD